MIDFGNTLMVSDLLQAMSRDCVVPGMSVVAAFEGSLKSYSVTGIERNANYIILNISDTECGSIEQWEPIDLLDY